MGGLSVASPKSVEVESLGEAVASWVASFRHMDAPELRRAVVEPTGGCPPEIGASLWTLQEARRRTLGYVQGISQAVLDWGPPGQRYSAATLLCHIAVFEVDWLYIDILGGKVDEERRIPECPPGIAEQLPYPILMEDGSYTPVSGEPLAVHLERLSAIRQAFVNVLTGMSMGLPNSAAQRG